MRQVVDASDGSAHQALTYDSFGRVLSDSAAAFQPFGFAGGLYDPDTGLVRFGARDYDPELGRWTAKDPVGFGGGTAGLYEYCANSPVNCLDLTGLRPLTPGEAGFLWYYFGPSYDTSTIDVGTSINSSRAWSPYGERISLPASYFLPNGEINLGEPRIAAVFAHEALHVWQRRNQTQVTLKGACLQIPYFFGGASPYQVTSTSDPLENLRQFLYGNIEQQGQIFQNFVYADLTGGDTRPYELVTDLVNSAP